ncbi:MAG: LysE family translocator [Desulfobacteraceae bacterium]|nr:LysE family translocator [Desulfobacteraceae bacterium]MBC2754294.1 LysE family translocator [Desulfobacteraceae bacterium]
MIAFLTTGIILGLSAGISPGPLLALVISETLRYDMKSGIKVALAPIITDAPVIMTTLLLSASLTKFNYILGGISFAGGSFILYLGINSIRSKGTAVKIDNSPSKSFQKGILANALSPHPYLFWFTVGAPIMTKAIQQDVYCVVSFIVGFYMLLVGSKIMLAVIAGKSRSFLTGRAYIFIMRVLGIILCIFAGFLFKDSLRYVGLL